LRLLDLTALVVGYGLAALLIRAFWHASAESSASVTAVLMLVYLWLGLAMSGPVVLLLDKRAMPTTHAPIRRRIGDRPALEDEPQPAAPTNGADGQESGPRKPGAKSLPRYTRAELAWLSIGAYWIGMTFLVVPARLHDSALAIVAVLQIVAALALWGVAPKQQAQRGGTSWTHWAAMGVLLSWPLAWAAMILLCKTLF
jgi:hypothetical protein